MENYSLLKEYLLAFSDKKLPAAEDQKVHASSQVGGKLHGWLEVCFLSIGVL